jgi:hypothetical protein
VNEAAKLAGLPVPPAVIRPTKRFSVFDLLRSQLGFRLPALGVGGAPGFSTFRTLLYLMD